VRVHSARSAPASEINPAVVKAIPKLASPSARSSRSTSGIAAVHRDDDVRRPDHLIPW
jgi:hypothetical protein